MKRLLLAGLLLPPFALARAQQHDAYGSLVGMAYSPDKGPLTEAVPDDHVPPEARRSGSAPAARAEAEFARPPEKRDKPAPRPAGREGAPAAEGDAPSVSVPAAAAPRVWTKFFASLMPPAGRLPSFEVAASTSPRRARPETPRADTAASAAGSAQGMLELVAAATTPAAP